MSQGSGGYDSDSVDLHALEDCPDAQYYHVQCRLGEGGGGGGYERTGASRSWGLRKQAIQNWQRRPYRNSTEGEEGDVSDVGSRTTESEAEMWEQDRRAEHGGNRGGYRLATGASLTCVGGTCRKLSWGLLFCVSKCWWKSMVHFPINTILNAYNVNVIFCLSVI